MVFWWACRVSKITKSYCTFTFHLFPAMAFGINNLSNKCENGPWPTKMNKQSTKVKQSLKIENTCCFQEHFCSASAGMWNTELSINYNFSNLFICNKLHFIISKNQHHWIEKHKQQSHLQIKDEKSPYLSKGTVLESYNFICKSQNIQSPWSWNYFVSKQLPMLL